MIANCLITGSAIVGPDLVIDVRGPHVAFYPLLILVSDLATRENRFACRPIAVLEVPAGAHMVH